jgi:hypothetical protein
MERSAILGKRAIKDLRPAGALRNAQYQIGMRIPERIIEGIIP